MGKIAAMSWRQAIVCLVTVFAIACLGICSVSVQRVDAMEAPIVQPRAKQAQVKHRYKTFTCDSYFIPEYDVEWKIYTFNKELIYTGDTALYSTHGNYGLRYGTIVQYECNYVVN